MRLPRLCLLLALTAVGSLRAAPDAAGDWNPVVIPPMKTSIYVGSVTLTTSEFRRNGDDFSATYEAKVWPWVFWSEHGRIKIHLPAADLAQQQDDDDPTGSERRRQPELDRTTAVEKKEPIDNEFGDDLDDDSDADAARIGRMRDLMQGVARQAPLDRGDGLDM